MDNYFNTQKHGFSLGIILFLVLIIVFYNLYSFSCICDNLYEGLWVADEDFCAKSQVDGMMIYIGEKSGWFNQERKVYLIMYSGDSILVNKKFNITICSSIFDKINPFINQILYRKIYLSNESDETSDQGSQEDTDYLENIMPLIQNAEINISEGRMTWTGEDDVVYADLYKDNLGSKYGKIA